MILGQGKSNIMKKEAYFNVNKTFENMNDFLRKMNLNLVWLAAEPNLL